MIRKTLIEGRKSERERWCNRSMPFCEELQPFDESRTVESMTSAKQNIVGDFISKLWSLDVTLNLNNGRNQKSFGKL